MNNSTSIHARALLVHLTISTWSARRYDKKISADVNSQYSASSDAGRYNKFLLPGDAASYKALITLAGAIRSAHYDHTLAWSDEGWRLLPTANYMQYAAWYRDQARALDLARDLFLADYPGLRSDARARLGQLYRDDDYPCSQDLRSRFSLSIAYEPLPQSSDIRVNLAADQIADIEQNVSDRLQAAIGIAAGDAWQRLYTVVKCITDRLSDPTAIFRDSLITNARETCDALQRLNVTNDPTLERMRAQVLDELTRVDPDVLRDTPDVRAQVARDADRILAQMSGMLPAQVA